MKIRLLLIALTIVFSCGTKNSGISKSSSKITISPAATTLLEVITGKFPGVTVVGDKVLIEAVAFRLITKLMQFMMLTVIFTLTILLLLIHRWLKALLY